jgi:LysR family glycine cleavage system transcriptional activator
MAMKHIPPIGCIVALEAVVNRGTIALAAEDLSLTASAVNHRITLLEQLLDLKLFLRGKRGLTLTPAGDRYYRALSGVLTQVEGAASSAMNQDESRTLTILGPADYMSLSLLPKLPKFAELYPAIKISVLTPQDNSSSKDPIPDLQIQGRPSDSIGLVVAALPESHYRVYGSAETLRDRPPKRAADLLKFPLIRTVTSCLSWETWFAHHRIFSHPAFMKSRLVSQNSLLSLQAAAGGMGLVLESREFACSFEQNGLLVEVLGALMVPPVCCYHLVYSQEISERPSVVRFRRWLLSETIS